MKYYLPFLVLMILISCTGGEPGKTDDKGMISPMSIQNGGEFNSLQEIRSQALGLIDHRISTNPEAYSMLTYGFWYPEFVFNDGKISEKDKYLGHWIKFNEDFTFAYGYYDKTFGKGKYHFRLDDKALIMVDNNRDMEPKIWLANSNGEAIALIGQHDLAINNGMQIKLAPHDAQPSKK